MKINIPSENPERTVSSTLWETIPESSIEKSSEAAVHGYLAKVQPLAEWAFPKQTD